MGRGRQVLVLFERSPNGVKALREAGEMIADTDAELTVVTVAARECRRCCGPSVEVHNGAQRDVARRELREAHAILGAAAPRAAFKLLLGHPEPMSSRRQLAVPLALWAGRHGFDLVILPRHPLAKGGHRAATAMRRLTSVEVRLVP